MKVYLNEEDFKTKKTLPGIYSYRGEDELIVLFTGETSGVTLKSSSVGRIGKQESFLINYTDPVWVYFTGQITLEN